MRFRRMNDLMKSRGRGSSVVWNEAEEDRFLVGRTSHGTYNVAKDNKGKWSTTYIPRKGATTTHLRPDWGGGLGTYHAHGFNHSYAAVAHSEAHARNPTATGLVDVSKKRNPVEVAEERLARQYNGG